MRFLIELGQESQELLTSFSRLTGCETPSQMAMISSILLM